MAYAIKTSDLGKQYVLGQKQRYKALRDIISERFRSLTSFQKKSVTREQLWALKDVNVEIQPGETVGVIGRNGAGKSTFLKVLSRITEPTVGEIRLRGRVGSLLEVGTGFHPELTGRENIFLNGAILGMRRTEIIQKFDQIVDFAEIERFIDTPVKRYSSGMYVRLAFAVAAHLEPEILLVDEVLAVGDVSFQKKCLGKMEDVSNQGRTVLFVSHNIQAITRLCQRVLMFENGKLVADGQANEVAGLYLRSGTGTVASRTWETNERPGNDWVKLNEVCIRTHDGKVSEVIDIRKDFEVELSYEVFKDSPSLVPYIQLNNEEGITAFVSFDTDLEWNDQARYPGRYTSRAKISGNLLSEGTYVVRVGMVTYKPWQKHFSEWDAVAFQVTDPVEGDSARGGFVGNIAGVVRPKLEWATEKEASARSLQTAN